MVNTKDGARAPGVRTDPAEAARFVTATGVDALARAPTTSADWAEDGIGRATAEAWGLWTR